MTSIFQDVVRDENDYTQLLCNLMQRCPDIAAELVSLLTTGRIESPDASSLTITTQYVSGVLGRKGGIPDLSIVGDSFTIFVEVKTDSSRDMEPRQLEAYRGCFPVNGKRFYCLLVPPDWRHHTLTSGISKGAPGWGIEFLKLDWHELSKRLGSLDIPTSDTIAHEVIQFFRRRFEMVDWTEAEKKLLSGRLEEGLSAIRKLEKIIDQVNAKAQSLGWRTVGEFSDPHEYGFYVKHEDQHLLWVGTWTEAPTPISIGFTMNWNQTKSTIQEVLGVPDAQTGNWRLYRLPDSSWFDPSAVWLALEPKLEAIRVRVEST